VQGRGAQQRGGQRAGAQVEWGLEEHGVNLDDKRRMRRLRQNLDARAVPEGGPAPAQGGAGSAFFIMSS
ncbi:MAG: hypothetical protein IIZ92_15565, partial [Aquincola sp.]|nr:hypothetical protein [Aquincola sp.]